MTTFERIKFLAEKQKKSLNKVEEDLGYGKNVLYRLKNTSPSAERLQELADYFNVSTDYLLERTDNPDPTSTGAELGWNDTIYKEIDPVDMTPKGRAIGRGFDQLDADKQDLFERLLKQMQEDDEDDD